MSHRLYKLICPACDFECADDGFLLRCPRRHPLSLLTTRYRSRVLQPDPNASGVRRYRCWLPDANPAANSPGPVTYRSERLGETLHLPNLWIVFSGYWPERGAALETATFKDLEACGVLSRIAAPRNLHALVVASAGNAAAAFAAACTKNAAPCLIVVPKNGMARMLFTEPLSPCIRIVSLTEGATYSDAISFAERISSDNDGFVLEGGVRNVGRRDGLATAMLNAVETIGKLPDYYFQAIGSGVGAIAANEAAKRLAADSRFGCVLPRLMLSQNRPFTPIYDSWKTGRRDLVPIDPSTARTLQRQIAAQVLSNSQPPYSIGGGVFDALRESRGDVSAVHNDEVAGAMSLFRSREGIDIDPAAGVALAALTKAASSGQIRKDSTVLLHITGGGARRRAAEHALHPASPHLEIPLDQLQTPAAADAARSLFAPDPRHAALTIHSR